MLTADSRDADGRMPHHGRGPAPASERQPKRIREEVRDEAAVIGVTALASVVVVVVVTLVMTLVG